VQSGKKVIGCLSIAYPNYNIEPCSSFLLPSFAKIDFLQKKPKGNQSDTKPKHGMDAV